MKRWLAVLLAAVLGFTLFTGCNKAETAPKKALIHMLDALQDGNISKAQKYTADGTFNIDLGNRRTKQFYTAMFSTLRYVIADTVVDGDSADVVVSVTMVDMNALLADASLDVLGNSLGGNGDSKKLYKLISEQIEAGGAATITSTVTAHLIHTEAGWMVDLTKSASFADAISGDLGELIGY